MTVNNRKSRMGFEIYDDRSYETHKIIHLEMKEITGRNI